MPRPCRSLPSPGRRQRARNAVRGGQQGGADADHRRRPPLADRRRCPASGRARPPRSSRRCGATRTRSSASSDNLLSWSSRCTPAGFYRLLLPRSLGGLQATDPLTYIRVVELLADGAGSVGWNVANNGVGSLVTLGLPDDGVQEIYPEDIGRDCRHRGAGRWPGGAGRGRLSREAGAGPPAAAVMKPPGCWAASRNSRRRPAAPPRRQWRHVPERGLFPRAEVEVNSQQLGGETGCAGTGLRLDGERISSCPSGARWSMPACRSTTSGGTAPGITYAPAGAGLRWAAPVRGDHQARRAPAHRRPCRGLPPTRRIARPAPAGCATIRRCRTRSDAPMPSSMPDASIATR